jgi:hypothetical protein
MVVVVKIIAMTERIVPENGAITKNRYSNPTG